MLDKIRIAKVKVTIDIAVAVTEDIEAYPFVTEVLRELADKNAAEEGPELIGINNRGGTICANMTSHTEYPWQKHKSKPAIADDYTAIREKMND